MSETEHPELLAPAGSPEALVAGLDNGADAVYLGLKSFNARSNAVNFSMEELAYWVPQIHNNYQARIYVTLNTVLKVKEMKEILQILDNLVQCGVDGIIFQDLGLAKILRDYFPELRRHASTQLAIHNLEGVRFCRDMGIERIVLAREITLEELKTIRKEFPVGSIELEVFCHGAMCYTYSGMCLFSGSVGGRSGNRGACAYTCRKGYRILNETIFPEESVKGSFENYIFSMKDMNTLDILDQLVETGIDSLKVEGRRKGPDYVGSTIAAYREALNHNRKLQLERESSLAFGRKYTRAFYEAEIYGDAPIDMHATGTQGILIGTMEKNNTFVLTTSGIQRRDGMNIVLPDHSRLPLSFNHYRVNRGNSHQPDEGTRITLRENFPKGSKVYWIKSHALEKKYTPALSRINPQSIPSGKVNLSVEVVIQSIETTYASSLASVSGLSKLVPDDQAMVRPKEILFRFGDTSFMPGRYSGLEEISGFIRKSELKAMRRNLLQKLKEEHIQARANRLSAIECQWPDREDCTWNKTVQYIIKTDDPSLLKELIIKCKEELPREHFIYDLTLKATQKKSEWERALELLRNSGSRFRLSLPMVLREWDLRILRKRIQAINHGEWSVSNAGQISLFDGSKTIIHADFPLYTLNQWAFKAWQERGISGRVCASIEDDRDNLSDLFPATPTHLIEIIAYTDTPLFIAEACSLAALYGTCPGAKVCRRETLHIRNEHGDQYSVLHDRCRSVVLDDKPQSWSGSLALFREQGVRYFRVDFSQKSYSADQAWTILQKVRNDQKIERTHSGNLFRTLV